MNIYINTCIHVYIYENYPTNKRRDFGHSLREGTRFDNRR